MPGSLISPCNGLSLTQSSVPYGIRKRKPLAAMVALSMSRAIARLWLKRRIGMRCGRNSQFRLSVLATVPVRMMRFNS